VIIHVFKCHYRKDLIQKTATAIDGGLLQDVTQMKLDVFSAMHFIAEAWRQITPTTIKNCFVKCGFSIDHVSNNDDSAVKFTEDEENGWHSLQPLGVQFEDCTTCDNAREVYGIQTVDQVLDQHLTRRKRESCRTLSNILGCTEGTGSSQKVHTSI
jgi:hypothetical protein